MKWLPLRSQYVGTPPITMALFAVYTSLSAGLLKPRSMKTPDILLANPELGKQQFQAGAVTGHVGVSYDATKTAAAVSGCGANLSPFIALAPANFS